MKPKTIGQILKDLYLSSMDNGEYDKEVLDTAVSEIQQLLEECAPYTTKYDAAKALRAGIYRRGQEQYHTGFNQAIDQYKSNIRGKLE